MTCISYVPYADAHLKHACVSYIFHAAVRIIVCACVDVGWRG